MDRWEIRPSPSDDDPQRHLLLMRGSGADVSAVLKKFGALCGRPTPLGGEDFNLSFVLHKASPKVRAKLEEWLEKSCPKPPAAEAAPTNPIPPMPTLVPAPAVPAVPPTPVDILPPIPPPPAGGGIPLPPVKEPLISLGPEIAITPPTPAPLPTPAPAPIPTPVPIPTEVRMATPPAAAAGPVVPAQVNQTPAAFSSAAMALTDELRADWTFETLLVGAYNRFAHAAAMSVVSSPGSMYNPLFLYGVPGTGKSHLLYAIAGSMSKGLGTSSLLLTSGARLSRAVSAAAAAGSMAAIDKKVADSKAIFVDDIHLLAVTEQNRDLLAKLFKSFFDRGLQVVITSMYPPKALGTLEEALRFTFSKGWSVDLKIPSPNIQRDLVSAVADRLGAQLSGDEVGMLAEKLTFWGYPELALWAKRIATLRKIRGNAGQPAPLIELLRVIYEPITVGSEGPPVSTAGTAFTPPAAPAGSEPMAVIVPKGQDGLVAYATKQFYEIGAKNGFTRTFNVTLWEAYDDMQQVGVPFQIADMCHRSGVTRALIVGPGPESPLAPRAAEFGHAVRRILDSSNVATGWIPHSQLSIAAHYVNAHLDFEK